MQQPVDVGRDAIGLALGVADLVGVLLAQAMVGSAGSSA